MATILKGKYASKQVVVNEWCDHWVKCEGRVYKITSLKFNLEEIVIIMNADVNDVIMETYEAKIFDDGVIFIKRNLS